MSTPPKFKNATCRGSYALGTACGNCERCAWERANMGHQVKTLPLGDLTDTEAAFAWAFLIGRLEQSIIQGNLADATVRACVEGAIRHAKRLAKS